MKKKILLLLSTAFLMLGLGACNKKPSTSSSQQQSSQSESSSSMSSEGSTSESSLESSESSKEESSEEESTESLESSEESSEQSSEESSQEETSEESSESSSGQEVPPSYTAYTVTDVPEEWNDQSDYYAWAWGGEISGMGAVYEASLEGTSITTSLPNDDTGFLLAKVAKGQEWVGSADWDTNLEAQSRNFEIDGSEVSFPFDRPAGAPLYLDLGGVKDIWEGKENAKIYVYFFEPQAEEWPGIEMVVGESGYYEGEFVAGSAKLIFNVNGWGGDCQTINIDVPTGGENLYRIDTDYTDGTSQSGSWSSYPA